MEKFIPDVKQLHCQHCNYRTQVKTALQQHVTAIHDKLKLYQCSHCDHNSAQKANLDKHLKGVHSQIKDWLCPKCAYSTAYKHHLKKHCYNVHKIDITKMSSLKKNISDEQQKLGGEFKSNNTKMKRCDNVTI